MASDLWDILRLVVAPALVTSLVLALVFVRIDRAGVGVLAGLLAGNYWAELVPWDSVPWRSADYGWPILLVASGLTSLLVDGLGAERLQRRPGRVVAALWIGILSWWLLYPDMSGMSSRMLAGLGVSITFLILVAAELHLPRPFILIGYVITCLVTAVVIYYAHSIRLAEIALLLGAGLAGVTLALPWTPGKITTLYGIATLFLPVIVFAGDFETYHAIPTVSFGLLVAAPCSTFLMVIPGVPVKKPQLRWIVAGVWAACLGVALALAIMYEKPYLN